MGTSTADYLKEMTLFEIEDMLIKNADEPHASVIARAILSSIKKGIDISTTTQLPNIIKDALKYVPKIKEDDIKKSCQRTFQALRIDVNNEFEVLDEFLEKLPNVLAKGGRTAIPTFYSREDRRVKISYTKTFAKIFY